MFLLVKGVNRIMRKEEQKPAVPPAPPREVVLLEEIRDLVKGALTATLCAEPGWRGHDTARRPAINTQLIAD